MKKVLITGANGFVGKYLIDQLSSKYEIIGIAGKDKAQPSSKGIKWCEGDIKNQDFLKKTISEYQPENIIHLAAIPQTWYSRATDIFEVNVFGTVNLYESVLEYRKKFTSYNPRIIFVGSAESYGNTKEKSRINETFPLNPVNLYGASKTSADRVSYAYTQSFNLDIVIARPFTHTGPGQGEGFFVPDMIAQIVDAERTKNKSTIKTGNLSAVRDYSDVRDVVKAYELLLDKNIKAGEAFNICSGQGIKIAEVLKLLLSFSLVDIKTEKDPKRFRAVDLPEFVGDNTKLTKTTCWKPEHALETTLRDSLSYKRDNP